MSATSAPRTVTPSMQLLVLKNVLVATRADDSGEAAAVAASHLAAAAGATLHAVFVVPAGASRAEANVAFQGILARGGVKLEPQNIYILEGDPAVDIGRLADKVAANLIVLGRGDP